MKILTLDRFASSIDLYVAARKTEEIFSQTDKIFNDRGAMAFSVPMSAFVPTYNDICCVAGAGANVDHQFDEATMTACINQVLADSYFTNWFGAWMVADGTHYMKHHAHLKEDVPTEKVFLFIPEIPAMPLGKILEV